MYLWRVSLCVNIQLCCVEDLTSSLPSCWHRGWIVNQSQLCSMCLNYYVLFVTVYYAFKSKCTLSLYQREYWLIFISIDRSSFYASHFKRYGVEIIFSKVEDISSKLDCEALPAVCSYRRAWLLSFFFFQASSVTWLRVKYSFKVITSLRKVEEIETWQFSDHKNWT